MAADPKYDPTEFQTVLRAWMERNDLSQMSAGHVLGISQGIINRWLKPAGDEYLVQPTIGSLEKLAPHLRVPLIDLKRMTNNLSPADLAVLTKLRPEPPDHRLQALVSDLTDGWQESDETSRHTIESVVRAVVNRHHNRSRKSRRQTGEDNPDPSPCRGSLMPAWA